MLLQRVVFLTFLLVSLTDYLYVCLYTVKLNSKSSGAAFGLFLYLYLWLRDSRPRLHQSMCSRNAYSDKALSSQVKAFLVYYINFISEKEISHLNNLQNLHYFK
jgi:hypothetical protein